MSPFSPMLATSGTTLSGGGWAVEPKLDGWRALVQVDGRVTVRTRNGRDITERLPELGGLVDVLGGRSAVFDGELVVGQGLPGDFYGLGPRLWSRRPTAVITFAAFDILAVDGNAVIGRTYSERRVLLEGLLLPGFAWTVVPSFRDDPGTVFVECVRAGLEGVVAKRRTSRYRPGKRSSDWVKAKAPAWRDAHAARRHATHHTRGTPGALGFANSSTGHRTEVVVVSE